MSASLFPKQSQGRNKCLSCSAFMSSVPSVRNNMQEPRSWPNSLSPLKQSWTSIKIRWNLSDSRKSKRGVRFPRLGSLSYPGIQSIPWPPSLCYPDLRRKECQMSLPAWRQLPDPAATSFLQVFQQEVLAWKEGSCPRCQAKDPKMQATPSWEHGPSQLPRHVGSPRSEKQTCFRLRFLPTNLTSFRTSLEISQGMLWTWGWEEFQTPKSRGLEIPWKLWVGWDSLKLQWAADWESALGHQSFQMPSCSNLRVCLELEGMLGISILETWLFGIPSIPSDSEHTLKFQACPAQSSGSQHFRSGAGTCSVSNPSKLLKLPTSGFGIRQNWMTLLEGTWINSRSFQNLGSYWSPWAESNHQLSNHDCSCVAAENGAWMLLLPPKDVNINFT